MQIIPAIDIYDKKAVRLLRGDYAQMTVYGNPLDIARGFAAKGASYIHLVDLEGAKAGESSNFNTVAELIGKLDLPCEIGGGIREMKTVESYVNAGADRIILGTSAVNDKAFLKTAVAEYGSRIAVGADVRDGFISVNGWTQSTRITLSDFIYEMQSLGISTFIVTDISKDGALSGTNLGLYKELTKTEAKIIASGGVTEISDVRELKKIGVYGAILGKALYSGRIDLADAIAAGEGSDDN